VFVGGLHSVIRQCCYTLVLAILVNEMLAEISSVMPTVIDDELEVVGVLGPKCAHICFDDHVLKKQVTYIVSLTWRSVSFSHCCPFVHTVSVLSHLITNCRCCLPSHKVLNGVVLAPVLSSFVLYSLQFV